MNPQTTPVVSSTLSRPAIMAGGTLVMLAMVLMVTSGGLTTNSVVRPVTHAPVLSVLALPVHVEACFQVSLDDELSGAPRVGTPGRPGGVAIRDDPTWRSAVELAATKLLNSPRQIHGHLSWLPR